APHLVRRPKQAEDPARELHVADPARAMMPALLDRLDQQPRAGFVAFALVHVALWTALPAALYPTLRLDLIEALPYGREWQLGYDKLPPLPWWLIELAYRAFGADWVDY